MRSHMAHRNYVRNGLVFDNGRVFMRNHVEEVAWATPTRLILFIRHAVEIDLVLKRTKVF